MTSKEVNVRLTEKANAKPCVACKPKYDQEYLRKVGQLISKEMAYAKDHPACTVKCSTKNGKIKEVLNVSTMAGLTCGNCSHCTAWCYEYGYYLRWSSVVQNRARNTELLLRDREAFFRSIEDRISRCRYTRYFRWHVGGEILDADYLDHMIQIAKRHPDWTFWTYTKMYHLVNARHDDIPDNLTIMFSQWRGMHCDNPYGFPIFEVIFPGEDPDENIWQCPGNCDICKAAHRGCPYGESVQNKAH